MPRRKNTQFSPTAAAQPERPAPSEERIVQAILTREQLSMIETLDASVEPVGVINIPVGPDEPADAISEPDPMTVAPEVPSDIMETTFGPLGDLAPAAPTPLTPPPAYVTFVSRDPNLKVNISGSVHAFEGGRLSVPEEHAAKFRMHHLFTHEHFYEASEVVVVGGKIVSVRRNATAINDALSSGRAVFLFKEEPNGRLVFITDAGFVEERFHDGVMVADDTVAARVRNHRFFIEGRITEASPVALTDARA